MPEWMRMVLTSSHCMTLRCLHLLMLPLMRMTLTSSHLLILTYLVEMASLSVAVVDVVCTIAALAA
jgi:hypothetical protein